MSRGLAWLRAAFGHAGGEKAAVPAELSAAEVAASPREHERLYAERHGYFWMPCPICQEPFGGHEWDDDYEQPQGSSTTLYLTKRSGCGVCRNPECRAEAWRRNVELYRGTPWHLERRYVPAPERKCGKIIDCFGTLVRCNYEADHVGEDGQPCGCGMIFDIAKTGRPTSEAQSDGSRRVSVGFSLSIPEDAKVHN